LIPEVTFIFFSHQGRGERLFMKKSAVKKSRDAVPLNIYTRNPLLPISHSSFFPPKMSPQSGLYPDD
jgi:hypothetical protein